MGCVTRNRAARQMCALHRRRGSGPTRSILKKAAANANNASKRLDDMRHKLILRTCDEILAGKHHDMFPLHVWMTGSGTQINMNVNEVIS
ncbi:MAG: hypothetical protein JO283_21725, partial [Bradyrhizobium sp.]|nr:hypothetical protein [Bradyrhizobium sp.]